MRFLVPTLMTFLIPLSASCQENPKPVDKPVTVNKATVKKPSADTITWLAVTNVADDDVLNMRAQPTGKSKEVYFIPYDATNLLQLDKSDKWVKVHYRGHSGWVYEKYLKQAAPDTAAKTLGGELWCVGTEPHWNIKTDKANVQLSDMEDDKALLMTSKLRNSINRTDTWLLSLSSPEKKHTFYQAVIQKQTCGDGMSDQDYPYTINVLDTHHTQLMSGCCKLK